MPTLIVPTKLGEENYLNHGLTFSAVGDTSSSPGCVRKRSLSSNKYIRFKTFFNLTLLTLDLSGPPSCLCSKTEACEITGDNELEAISNVYEVTMSDGLKN